jgi:hypothetical protein
MIAPLLKMAPTAKYRLEVVRTAPVWDPSWDELSRGMKRTMLNDVHYVSVATPAAADPTFGVSSGTRVVVSQNGVGSLQVAMRRKPETQGKVLLVVSCADLADVKNVMPSGALKREGADWLVSVDGAAELALKNLSSDFEVNVTVVDEKGVGPAGVRVRVREIPQPEK